MTKTSLPYQEVTDDSYAEKAAATFTIEEPRPGLRVLRGNCPRCGALIDVPVMPTVFDGMRSLRRQRNGAVGQAAAAAQDIVEPMLCTCDDDHPRRPEGRKGCGAYWNFVISVASA